MSAFLGATELPLWLLAVIAALAAVAVSALDLRTRLKWLPITRKRSATGWMLALFVLEAVVAVVVLMLLVDSVRGNSPLIESLAAAMVGLAAASLLRSYTTTVSLSGEEHKLGIGPLYERLTRLFNEELADIAADLGSEQINAAVDDLLGRNTPLKQVADGLVEYVQEQAAWPDSKKQALLTDFDEILEDTKLSDADKVEALLRVAWRNDMRRTIARLRRA